MYSITIHNTYNTYRHYFTAVRCTAVSDNTSLLINDHCPLIHRQYTCNHMPLHHSHLFITTCHNNPPIPAHDHPHQPIHTITIKHISNTATTHRFTCTYFNAHQQHGMLFTALYALAAHTFVLNKSGRAGKQDSRHSSAASEGIERAENAFIDQVSRRNAEREKCAISKEKDSLNDQNGCGVDRKKTTLKLYAGSFLF